MADIISRHSAGLTLEKIKQLTRPRYIMVAAIGLNIDSQVMKELKDLAAYQDNDPHIKNLKDQVTNQIVEVHDWRCAVVDGVIHCENHEGYSVWRQMLPSSLQNKVVTFVHLSLGHAGSEKCIAGMAPLLCKKKK